LDERLKRIAIPFCRVSSPLPGFPLPHSPAPGFSLRGSQENRKKEIGKEASHRLRVDIFSDWNTKFAWMSGSGWSSVYLHFRSKDIANTLFCRYTYLLMTIFIALHGDTIFKFTGKLLEARLEHIRRVRNEC
jgi:hypothetical protein